MNSITIGQYFPGESPIHRMDPRAKLILTVILLVDVFLVKGAAGFLIILCFLALCAMVSRLPIRYFFRGLKPIAVIAILTFVMNLFLQNSGTVLWSWGPLHITSRGLETAVFMAVRLLLLVSASQVLTLTTSSISLTDGLESLMRPLEKLRFPAHEISMMMSIALRFIPTLMEETNKIMNAQKARGADFDSRNLIRRARSLVPLLVPLFLSAFRRADDLAQAMEARCYAGGKGRTRMKQLRFSKPDLSALIAVLLLSGLIILVNPIPGVL